MKRTIEKLAQERKEKEYEFAKRLEKIKEKTQEIQNNDLTLQLQHHISHLEEILKPGNKISQKQKPHPFFPSKRGSKEESLRPLIEKQLFLILAEVGNIMEQNLKQNKELFSSLIELNQLTVELMDTKDKEWDALGSNHVGMIFKSMEWRVDKLTNEYKDANILMKRFIHLKEKLNQLICSLEEKKLPTPIQTKEILGPLEDFCYAGFENRYRGSEEEIKKQQESYIPYFQNKKTVLDLGCGRGEFIELLGESDIEAEGIDINGEMIEICQDKGLNCQKADILEKLAEYEDGSLGGLFSSQVIEHLTPDYLKRMIELAYFKLAPSSYIVLETINPTSVFSLVQIFNLDLSHQKPIHPQTLQFLLESAGFDAVEIRYSSPLEQERLQDLPQTDENSVILNQNIDKLNKLLYDSPNYAALGLKK